MHRNVTRSHGSPSRRCLTFGHLLADVPGTFYDFISISSLIAFHARTVRPSFGELTT